MTNPIKKILIIRFGVLGDVVLTTPVIRVLSFKYQGAMIDYLIKEKYSSLIKYHPDINHVYTIPENASKKDLLLVISELKKNNYDLIVDLHSNLRSSIVRRKLKKSRQLIYKKDILRRRILTNFKINLFKSKKHVVERYMHTIGNNSFPLPEVYSNAEAEIKINNWIKSLNLEKEEVLIGFNPGAIHFTKRWPVKNFINLGRSLSQYKIKIVILGGNEDLNIAEQIAESVKEKAIIAAGKFNILETFEIIKHLKFLVTGDTGLMHLSNAARTPVVAIFGPTVSEFGFWAYGNKDIIIEKDLSCRPCSLHGTSECPIGNHQCMENIFPEEVFTVCSKKLE